MYILVAQAAVPGGNLGLLLALVLVLVIINGLLAGSEVALVSLRESQLRQLEQRGAAGRALVTLARDPNRFLSTVQIGITLAGFLAAGSATQPLAGPLADVLAFLGAAARPVAIVLVTLALTFVTLVIGELAPKRIALQRAERWGLLAARPLSVFAKLTAPAVWLLTQATEVAVRLAGVDPNAGREDVSEEELRDLISTRGYLEQQQRSIISGAFELHDRSVREILVPRPQVLAFDQDTPVDQVIGELVGSGHSRAPVYRGDLDDVLGIVHLRDLVLKAAGTVAEATRSAPILPETVGVLDALRRMQAGRQHMALVVNEHGGIEGILTLEDVLEEIVGEIYDEFDRDLDSADVRGVRRNADGSYTVPGSFPMHDLDDLGIELPEGDYATVAGLVLAELGRVPDEGESVDLPSWRIDVLSRRRNKLERLRLVPTPDRSAGDGAEGNGSTSG